jgi:hypothetical protein
MIPMERVRPLELGEPAGPDDSRRVQAASGLVIIDEPSTWSATISCIWRSFPTWDETRAAWFPCCSHLPADESERKE